MAINIDFLANVSRFLRGAGDAEDALGDVGDALDELASDAQRNGNETGDHLAAGVKDGTADAETAVGKLEASFTELAAKAKREGAAAGGNISHAVKAGTHDAEEGVKTLKENTGSNLKEVAASFDGTWQSAGSGAQGLVAEIAEGFGPLGLIAGAVAAGGIGLILTGMGDAETATEEAKAAVADLAGQLIDAGTVGRRSMDDIASKIHDMATGADGPKLTDLWKDAKGAGLDYQEVVEAIASGDARQLAGVQSKLNAITSAHIHGAEQAAGYGRASSNAANVAGHANDGLAKTLKTQAGIAREAARAQELAAKAGLSDLGLKAKELDQLHDGWADAAAGVGDYIDSETGVFDTSRYIRAMEKRQDALRHYAETLATSKLSPEARSFIESQGADQAAAMLEGYRTASPKQRHELERIWKTAGRASANSFTDAIGGRLRDYTAPAPSVAPINADSWEREVRAAHDRAQAYLRDHPLQAGAIAYAGGNTPGKPLY